MVELLRLELVHREHQREAAAPQIEERAHEGHVAEDPGLVLDEDRLDVVADVFHLVLQVGRVEVPHADEGDLVPTRAQPVAYRERVVMDAALLITGEHDHPTSALGRQLEIAERERFGQALADARAGEVLEPALAARDEVLARRAVVDHALERGGHAVRRLLLDEDARVAERLGDRAGGVRDDWQPRAHRLDERDAEALVVGEREQRGRAAVVRHQLFCVHAAGERHVLPQAGILHLAGQAPQVRAGHRGRADQVEMRAAISLAIARERRDDVVDRLLREDLPDDQDRRALVRQTARHGGIGRDVELLPVVQDRHDRGLR